MCVFLSLTVFFSKWSKNSQPGYFFITLLVFCGEISSVQGYMLAWISFAFTFTALLQWSPTDPWVWHLFSARDLPWSLVVLTVTIGEPPNHMFPKFVCRLLFKVSPPREGWALGDRLFCPFCMLPCDQEFFAYTLFFHFYWDYCATALSSYSCTEMLYEDMFDLLILKILHVQPITTANTANYWKLIR